MVRSTLRVIALGAAAVWCSLVQAQQQIDVWPGDVSNNGVVDGVDVLFWGFAYQAPNGIARATISTDWSAQAGQAWQSAGGSGVDFAHADANGDGVVDHQDLNEAIYTNFGLTHGSAQPDDLPAGGSGQMPHILLLPVNTPGDDGDTLFIDVMLGTDSVPVQDFLGTTFEFTFNPQFVADHPDAIQFGLFSNAWIGSSPSETTIFLNKDLDAGSATVALVRQNNDPVSGYGLIGRLSIIMEDLTIVRPPAFLKFGIQHAVWAGGTQQLGPVRGAALNLPWQQLTSSAVLRTSTDEIRLYPNPVRNTLYLKDEDDLLLTDASVALFDQSGRLLTDYSPKVASEVWSFPVHHLPPGTYVVRITSGQRTCTKRFLKR